jgi:Tol biopolymer transport system component
VGPPQNELFSLRPDGIEPFPAPQLKSLGAGVWSPDGSQIAIDGVPASVPSVRQTTFGPRSLDVMDSRGGHVRKLVTGLQAPAISAWSPDGRWLAVTTQTRDGPYGLWVVSVRTGRTYLVLHNGNLNAGAPVWLPDGRLIVGIGSDPGLGCHCTFGHDVLRLSLPSGG